MPGKPIRIVAVFEIQRQEGPPCDPDAVREAFDDELQGMGEIYAQDDEHEEESEFAVELISTDLQP